MAKSKKITKKDTLITAAFVLAITAARDTDTTQEQDKIVLAKIRNCLNQVLTLDKANPTYAIFATAGMSEEDGIKLVDDMLKEI